MNIEIPESTKQNNFVDKDNRINKFNSRKKETLSTSQREVHSIYDWEMINLHNGYRRGSYVEHKSYGGVQ